MRLSVIIPAYNEEKAIGQIVNKIKNFTPADTEIIVVDDGSDDNTGERVHACGASVIRHLTNRGKGVSIRNGVASAKAEVVLFIDGDGQDDPADIPKLLQAMDLGADLVIGSRWLGVLEEGAISRINHFVSEIITAIINLFFHCNVTDSQAGFRCIKKHRFEELNLRAKGYDIETEMTIKASKRKLKIVEIPVCRSKRTSGKSKLKRLRLGIKIISIVLKELITH